MKNGKINKIIDNFDGMKQDLITLLKEKINEK